jgi:outer membrane receptor protein involved in Fe transport
LASLTGSYARKHVPGPVNSASPGSEVDLDAHSSVVWTAGPDLGTSLGFSHQVTSLEWDDAGGRSVHLLNTFGLNGQWQGAVSDVVAATAGGDGQVSTLSSTVLGALNSATAGFWVSATYAPAAGFDVVSSVKALWAGPGPVLVPKLGLATRWSRGTLKANLFRAFKLPTLNDLFWPADATAQGNPGLKPEDGWGTDLVVEARWPGWGSIESSAYATRLVDAILWQPSAGKWRPQNIGEAVAFGSDLAATGLVGPFSLTARYSFVQTYLLSGGLAWADDRRLPYQPVHKAGFTAKATWGWGSLAVDGRYEGPRFVGTLNLASLPSFFTLGLSVDQGLGPDLSLFVSAQNLLGASYSSVQGYPMPGASLAVGLRYRRAP